MMKQIRMKIEWDGDEAEEEEEEEEELPLDEAAAEGEKRKQAERSVLGLEQMSSQWRGIRWDDEADDRRKRNLEW